MKEFKIEDYKLIDKDRYIFYEDGKIYSKWFKKIIDGCLTDDGYIVTSLKLKDGRSREFLVHNVIAFIFCEIPTNIPSRKLVVDHKNTVRNDNRVCNLRWTDTKGNNNNPITKQHQAASSTGRKQSKETIEKRVSKLRNKQLSDFHKKKISEGKYKTILQFTLDGEFVKEWSSGKEISEVLGFSKGIISMCCNGKRKQAYGYIWRFKD